MLGVFKRIFGFIEYYSMFFCFLSLAVLLAIELNAIFTLNMQLNDINGRLDNIERMKMYDKSAINDGNINGYYSFNDYYCVWTKGRNPMDINETDSHEICHAFINKKYVHFCGDNNQSAHN